MAPGLNRRAPGKDVVWKVNLYDSGLASVRYRCIYPAHALRLAGQPSEILERDETILDFSAVAAVVFVKTFELRDLALARSATARAIPIVFDLCDNIFVEAYGGERHGLIVANFLEMARMSSAVSTTTDALAEVLREKLRDLVPVVVIPDTVETRDLIDVSQTDSFRPSDSVGDGETRRALSALVSLGRVKRRIIRAWSSHRDSESTDPGSGIDSERETPEEPIRFDDVSADNGIRGSSGRPLNIARTGEQESSSGAKVAVWFGNSGSGHGSYGLQSLREIAPAIVTVAREIDLRLVVVSNDRQLFDLLIAPLPITSAYFDWEPYGCLEIVAGADVCLIPNSMDEFSRVKSANRVLLALGAGTPVVATSVPALEAFGDCVIFDDFEAGMRAYLSDNSRGRRDVDLASALIDEKYSLDKVGSMWLGLLSGQTAPERGRDRS